jgi:hypothetical protein
MITKLLEEIEKGKDWEDKIFNMSCEIASHIAKQVFTELDEKLAGQRNTKTLRLIDKRKKTLVTRFGSITINRNYYKDSESGNYRYLLDEKLGIEKHKNISPGLTSLSTLLATLMPFRNVSFCLDSLLPKSSSLSHQYIHKALQKEASMESQKQEIQTKALFENGEIPKDLKQK